jgi:F-type H+-transporting ATPase subunit epsilon
MTFAGDVNEIVVWGTEGQLGILPHHVPLMTMLRPGDLLIKKGEEEQYMAISGGFLEVGLDKVVILADACERAEEIDIERAKAARRQAEKTLKTSPSKTATITAEAALRRSLVRLKVARKKPHR